jgi:4'-phosphopantetheinyl transferase
MIFWDLRSADEHPYLLEGEPPAGLLSAPERVFFGRLRVPKRRREWLLGRYAIKALCRAWFAMIGRRVPASSLTVAAAPDGSPYVLLAGEGPLPITVSLSHRGDMALCALVPQPQAPLGVDLELCEPRPPLFIEDFFTLQEATAVANAPDRCRAATEIWALKEAALKALRVGLSVDTHTVQARPRLAACSGWSAAGLEASSTAGHRSFTAYVRDSGPFVVTVAWGAGPCPEPSDALRGSAVILSSARSTKLAHAEPLRAPMDPGA